MAKQMKLKTKLLSTGLTLTLLPLLAAMCIALYTKTMMTSAATEETHKLALADLDHITQSVYSTLKVQQESLQQTIDSALNIARDVMTHHGTVCFTADSASWTAVNQNTRHSVTIALPQMLIGTTPLGQNADIEQTSPIVDKVKQLVGATCTIFQRMNEEGDMLRVCTNVETLEGKRAIGTYIPRANSDGSSNPVVAAVLKGQTFRGRAFVVNRWYITSYEPILDQNKKVVGALYVGIPQENVPSLRKAVMDIQVGKTGYVYVLDSQGNYVISYQGKRDTENIWNAKDAGGNLFIQEICRKATSTASGQIIEQRYPWKNPGEAQAREKIARLMYFEPWDWIIGASSYIDEFEEAPRRMNAIGHTAATLLVGIACVSGTLALLIWLLMSKQLTGRIERIVAFLSEGAKRTVAATGKVATASQSFTEHAAGLEEMATSIEEMSSMTKRNAENAQQANAITAETSAAATTGDSSMQQMNNAILDIQKSAEETAKIIKVIDEIAFQTNLLALNAAVEAARAGEAGKSFAVVAEEVRNLAMRSAEAAQNTSGLIEQSIRNAQNGVTISAQVGKALKNIVSSVGNAGQLVNEIAAATQEQAQGIHQINSAMNDLDKATQQNVATVEESAHASKELYEQAEQMNELVRELAILVGGENAVNTVVAPAVTVSPRC